MFISVSFDVSQTGSTALHFAAENCHLKTVEFLLIVGATDHPNEVQWKRHLCTEGLVPYLLRGSPEAPLFLSLTDKLVDK